MLFNCPANGGVGRHGGKSCIASFLQFLCPPFLAHELPVMLINWPATVLKEVFHGMLPDR